MEPIKKVSPRELADAVESRYHTRLSFQEALVFHLFIYAEGLVTYTSIENRLWTGESAPMSARRAIYVTVSMLRRKVPRFEAKCEVNQGYNCNLGIADVYP